jgi:hypothetical protein
MMTAKKPTIRPMMAELTFGHPGYHAVADGFLAEAETPQHVWLSRAGCSPPHVPHR